MRICDKCGTQVKDGLSFCQKCGNVLGDEPFSEKQTAAYSPSPIKPKKKIGCLTLFLWIFFLPIMIIVMIAKSEKLSKKQKTVWITVLVVVFLFIGIIAPKDNTATTNGSTGISANSNSSQSNQVVNSNPDMTANFATKNNEYHSNDAINQIIAEFNKIADKKIEASQISKDYTYQTFITTSDTYIRIAKSDVGLFVDLTEETNTEDNLKYYFKNFVKCLSAGTSDSDIDKVYQQLQTGKYSNYSKYNALGLNFSYTKSKLNNDSYDYKITIEQTAASKSKTEEQKKSLITSIDSSETVSSWETEVGGIKKISYFILPYEVEEDDIKIISTNPEVAETKFLDMVGVTGKKVLTMSIITKSIGDTSVYVKSSDDSISSKEFKVTVKEKQEPPKDTSRTVYVTPSGNKYHYDPQCGGKNSTATTLNQAKRIGLSPCSKCVN